MEKPVTGKPAKPSEPETAQVTESCSPEPETSIKPQGLLASLKTLQFCQHANCRKPATLSRVGSYPAFLCVDHAPMT